MITSTKFHCIHCIIEVFWSLNKIEAVSGDHKHQVSLQALYHKKGLLVELEVFWSLNKQHLNRGCLVITSKH